MATPYTLERPKTAERVIGFVVSGMTDLEVSRAISTKRRSVSQPAITQFRQRHAAEIEAAKAALVEATRHHWIADQQQRIEKLEQLFDDVQSYQDENGLSEVTIGYDDQGGERSRTVRFAGAIVAAKRGILSDVSDELGQKVKPDQNVNLRAQVLIRGVTGFDPAELG